MAGNVWCNLVMGSATATAGCVKGKKIAECKASKARFQCKRCGLLARKKGVVCKPAKR
jgi:hypothetical protein